MEEDIMILESECYYLEELGYLRENNHFIRFNQALGNLIKRYKELEEELKREKIWRIRLEKENEDTCNEVNNGYIRKELVIPKSQIKEKIEELKEEKHCFYSDYAIEERNNKIQVLQELLEKEDE